MSATTTQVATAYLTSLPGITTGKVGPTLPSDVSTWASTGFWQVRAVGGSPDPDLGTHLPVIEVSCWAATPESAQAPFNRAESMAEYVRQQAQSFTMRTLSVQTGWNPQVLTNVRLMGVIPVTEPLRLPDPNLAYARVALNLQLWWNE